MARLLHGFEIVLPAFMLPGAEHGEAKKPYRNLRTITFSFVPANLSRETFSLASLLQLSGRLLNFHIQGMVSHNLGRELRSRPQAAAASPEISRAGRPRD